MALQTEQKKKDLLKKQKQDLINRELEMVRNKRRLLEIALQNALKNNTFAEITSKSGKKLLGLHGNLNGEGEYCGLIAPNDWKCGEEFQQWLREKGFQNHQIITCKGGVLPNSLTNVKDPISVGLPQAPNPNDPNSPVFVSVQK